MNANTITKKEEQVNISSEASKFGLSVVMGMAALIGIWGAACLIGGLADSGISGLAMGLLTAVTGA